MLDKNDNQKRTLGSLKFNFMLILASLSGISIIILASNLDFFCVPKQNRLINVSNEELFLIYSVIFSFISIFLLKLSSYLKYRKFKLRTITYLSMLTIQLFIMSMLFMIFGQIKILSSYNSAFFYTLVYTTLTTSAAFLVIAAMQFMRWFSRGKNHIVLTYGLVMLVLCSNSIVGVIYVIEASFSLPVTVKNKSCSLMVSALSNPNPEAINVLSNMYDATSFFSFVLAWLVTVLMLREYTRHKNKLIYWLIFALPLIIFLPRYEIALYYFSSNQVDSILTSINLNSNIYGYQTLNTVLSSNLQLGGAFFGMAFLTIAAKVTIDKEQKKSLILTGFGIMFLFASKDISSLIIASFPPLGAISIAFMGIASYITYVGIYNTALLAARDKKLRSNLRSKIENNMKMLTSIASSQDRLEIEKNVKELMNLSGRLQERNDQPELTQNEIREIVKDVIAELKKKQKTS
jgi:hypothetical protein